MPNPDDLEYETMATTTINIVIAVELTRAQQIETLRHQLVNTVGTIGSKSTVKLAASLLDALEADAKAEVARLREQAGAHQSVPLPADAPTGSEHGWMYGNNHTRDRLVPRR